MILGFGFHAKVLGHTSYTDSLPVLPTSYFKFSTTYLTDAVYNGRKDSLAMPYLTPSLGYYDKSGFYISVSMSYLTSNSIKRIDLVSLNAGYDFSIGKSVGGGVYASKDFYNRSSTTTKSEIKGELGAYLSYDPGFVTLGGGVDLLLSGSSDVSVNGSLSHSFTFGETGNEWSISPSLTANFGTQNYYQNLLVNRGKKKNGNTGTVQVGNNKFSVLSYDVSLPFAFDANKWGCFFTPTYAIPQSPVSRTSPGGSVFIIEKLENVFYAELGFYLKF